eukprot:scaffold18707_cov80-Skeletonema_dohrnii-CCMP3373.AAC.2
MDMEKEGSSLMSTCSACWAECSRYGRSPGSKYNALVQYNKRYGTYPDEVLSIAVQPSSI